MTKKVFLVVILSVFFGVIFVLFGCQNKRNKMVESSCDKFKTVIIPGTRDINIQNDGVICDLDFIILEEKEKSYFGHVSKLRVHQERIFVLDSRHAKAVFIYTIEGKHIATVGDQKGRGPHEFVNVSNFEIDYVNDQLLVIDDFGYKFMIYDLDGNFLKRVDSDIVPGYAALLPNGYIVHAKASHQYRISGQSDNYIFITDDNKSIVKEGFDYDDNENMNILVLDILRAHYDGTINFAPKFRDTIYTVSADLITPKYAIEYGNTQIISKNRIDELGSAFDLFKLMDAGLMCFMGTHVESKDILYLALGYWDNAIYVFYNKKTNNTIAISHSANITKYEYEILKILCSDDDGYLYGAFNFANIEELVKIFPDLEKMDTTKDYNPIIFKYKVNI